MGGTGKETKKKQKGLTVHAANQSKKALPNNRQKRKDGLTLGGTHVFMNQKQFRKRNGK